MRKIILGKWAISLLVLLSVFFSAQNLRAQEVYGNEWINYKQVYYKLKVVNTGLHRLSYGYLDSLGLAAVNPKHFQLFRRGKEVPLYVAGEQDSRLDVTDYIEFIGEKNDGALDRELYKDPADQVHQLYSLYTDTAAYFLTYSPAGGKRMREQNPAVNGKTPEPYHLQKVQLVMTERYYLGRRYGENGMPWLDLGEGYFSHSSRNAKAYDLTGITNVVTTGPKPQLEFAVGTQNLIQHLFAVNLKLPPTGGTRRPISRYELYGNNAIKGKTEVEFSEIYTSNKITLETDPGGLDANQVSLAYARLTFPQRTIFPSGSNQLVFYTDSLRGAAPYYEYAGVPATAVAYDVTNPDAILRVEGYINGNNKGFIIQNSGHSHKVLIANTAKPFKPVAKAEQLTFRQINPAAHDYIVLTNKRLMKKVGSSNLAAPMEYAAYRASEEGGGYDTLLITTDQVINLFHYGEFSANAIRRMMKFMMTSERPKQLFIIGKGSKYAGDDMPNYLGRNIFSYYQVGNRDKRAQEIDLVPTGLAPSSDFFFTIDFKNGSHVPKVPTGRLAVSTPLEVMNYLNKVKEYEKLPANAPWRKNILQLGGGKTTSEINQIAAYLSNYKSIAEGPYLGANVIEKYRQNVSEVVEAVNVSDEVNTGVSLITFFGHSSRGTTDLDIGTASDPINGYRNAGKYPVMLMNGCSAGDAFIPNNNSFGEDWLKTPDKGAIAMIAHVESGYPNFLNLYSANFYTVAFQDENFYGKSIGVIQQETIRRVMGATSSDLAVAMVTQMVLQGDPGLKMYSPDKPDYAFVNNELNVRSESGEVVTATSNNFLLSVRVNNLGKAIPDSIYVSVKRTLPDNSIVVTDSIKVKPILRPSELLLPLDNRGLEALGMNSFEIFLDHTQSFAELSEDNNIGRFQHYFPASGLVAISPSEYGIVSSKDVKLLAQATQVLTNKQGFYFEIDTTLAFNSTLKRTFTAENATVPMWELTLPQVNNGNDSTVYYWRARFQNYAAGEDTVWANSSFRYIPGSSQGWSQSHYGQFDKAQTVGITKASDENSKWEFIPTKQFIDIKTVGGAVRYAEPTYGMYINEMQQGSFNCGNPTGSTLSRIFVIVFDNIRLEKVTNIPGQVACSSSPHLYTFTDMTKPATRNQLEAFLNAVPQGYHVAVMTVNNVPFNDFSPTLKAAFNNIGSELINDLQNGYPFAIVGQKGAAPGTAQELTASLAGAEPATSQSVVLRASIQTGRPSGTITSSVIGPALNWDSLHHNIERAGGGDDKYTLSVTGVKRTGEEQVLQENVEAKSFDLSFIDAAEYPNLRLSAYVEDETARTAPQLKQWLVYYDVAPEGIIRPDLVEVNEQILSAQANEGSLKVPMAFQNVTSSAFGDSLLVEVTLTGDGIQPTVSRFKIEKLEGNKTAFFDFRMSTLTLDGNYKLSMYVNPRHQLEQHYFNNIYEVSFKVKAKLHPILDVAFDGRHLLDGELVSPSPLISVTLKDENKHNFLQNPSGMSIILVTENGQQEVDLINNAQEVQFFPADEKNDFRLEYKPLKLDDGKYTLEVRGKDVAGKASGIAPYRIGFEVEGDATVTNFYPFPNPFSTKTNFIFTLTGSKVPDEIKIQVLTVTGKVVKEIMKEELGPLRIGNNKTEYAWDGTDTYGDRLANGVYLYRVVMSNELDMKHKYKNGDKSFKNGYGKIYILR
ncbi:C25 family cysteine peptidase [Pontibacter harenae]|uniref:putative type IX secretion system sortase PorU2 n=1 Tax=Pontibacter harenae TaxID=2894083 RepID=UPI001E57A819|nr:C25 family cysteine peptidase [Pontibacter harenae]MCC9165710.1 C25 family cysteine peptidase [Pontibacter harenae]